MKNKIRVLMWGVAWLWLSWACSSRPQEKGVEAAEGDAFAAEGEFADTLHDFGSLRQEAGAVRYVFSFSNRGQVPAVVLDVDASCHCLSVKYTREVVRPGGKGEVVVTFDAGKSGTGYFNKSVRVRLNSRRGYTLVVRGEVG